MKASFVADGLVHLIVCFQKLSGLLNQIEKSPYDQDLMAKYDTEKRDALRLLGKLKDMSLAHIIDNARKFGTNFLNS